MAFSVATSIPTGCFCQYRQASESAPLIPPCVCFTDWHLRCRSRTSGLRRKSPPPNKSNTQTDKRTTKFARAARVSLDSTKYFYHSLSFPLTLSLSLSLPCATHTNAKQQQNEQPNRKYHKGEHTKNPCEYFDFFPRTHTRIYIYSYTT